MVRHGCIGTRHLHPYTYYNRVVLKKCKRRGERRVRLHYYTTTTLVLLKGIVKGKQRSPVFVFRRVGVAYPTRVEGGPSATVWV